MTMPLKLRAGKEKENKTYLNLTPPHQPPIPNNTLIAINPLIRTPRGLEP